MKLVPLRRQSCIKTACSRGDNKVRYCITGTDIKRNHSRQKLSQLVRAEL